MKKIWCVTTRFKGVYIAQVEVEEQSTRYKIKNRNGVPYYNSTILKDDIDEPYNGFVFSFDLLKAKKLYKEHLKSDIQRLNKEIDFLWEVIGEIDNDDTIG